MRFKIRYVIAAAAAAAAAAVCAVNIYNINSGFPNPDIIETQEGGTFLYKGLTATVGELELYENCISEEAYPGVSDNLDPSLNAESDNLTYNWVIANITIKNETSQDISLGKESIMYWIIECGNESNGADAQYFMALNEEYDGQFKSGEELQMKLVYYIPAMYMSWEELKESDIKIVYSYYPTKNYILYKGNL